MEASRRALIQKYVDTVLLPGVHPFLLAQHLGLTEVEKNLGDELHLPSFGLYEHCLYLSQLQGQLFIAHYRHQAKMADQINIEISATSEKIAEYEAKIASVWASV